jgi:Resolvase, N terminal domain
VSVRSSARRCSGGLHQRGTKQPRRASGLRACHAWCIPVPAVALLREGFPSRKVTACQDDHRGPNRSASPTSGSRRPSRRPRARALTPSALLCTQKPTAAAGTWRSSLTRATAKDLNRPGLASALERLDSGDADALLALRLDRVSRSVADFAGLLARAKRRSWCVVLLSPNLDTEDAAGKFTAHVLAAAAEYERDLISARTREGMAQRRAEGVHVGRPTISFRRRCLPHRR